MSLTNTSYFGQALVAHLDILGFKNILDSVHHPQDIFELGSKIESAFVRMRINEEILIRTFSDNIMLVYPVADGKITDKQLFSFVHYIAKSQIELISRFGWVVRGAISFGEHYHSDLTIVSKPLIEAYQLESQKVNYPFVGICNIPELPMRITPSSPHRDSEAYNLIDLLTFSHPHHEFLCIDYLTSSLLSEYMHGTTTERFLSIIEQQLLIHKNFIQAQLQSAVTSKIINKYNALAWYHNNFLSRLFEKLSLLSTMGLHFQIDGVDFIRKFRAQEFDLLILDLPRA